MKEYDLYLFDFDNTLFDTSSGIRAILREALPAIGVEYRDEDFGRYLGMSMDDIFHTYSRIPGSYGEYERRFYEVVRSDAYLGAEPFPEVPDVLRELKSEGKKIGIASGKMRYKIERLLKDTGLGDIPDTVVGWEDTERHKPDPAPLELASSRFDVPKERTLYVGDSANDSGAASAFGVDCAIVVRPGGIGEPGLPCTYQIEGLNDILLYARSRSKTPANM